MNTPPDQDLKTTQRAGVRRTVAILAFVAVAAYALFLYSAMRGGG